MDTKEDLKKLECQLREIHECHHRTTAYWVLVFVVFLIFIIFFASYTIKQEVHDAILREDISGQVKVGFDQVMENYEVVE